MSARLCVRSLPVVSRTPDVSGRPGEGVEHRRHCRARDPAGERGPRAQRCMHASQAWWSTLAWWPLAQMSRAASLLCFLPDVPSRTRMISHEGDQLCRPEHVSRSLGSTAQHAPEARTRGTPNWRSSVEKRWTLHGGKQMEDTAVLLHTIKIRGAIVPDDAFRHRCASLAQEASQRGADGRPQFVRTGDQFLKTASPPCSASHALNQAIFVLRRPAPPQVQVLRVPATGPQKCPHKTTNPQGTPCIL